MPQPDHRGLAAVAARQCGVVSRRQVLDHGLDDVEVERRLRRRLWARVHDGVYVDHTGALSWDQRAWAAVLVHWPSALSGASALRSEGLRPGGDDTIELVVPEGRQVTPVAGVRVRRLTDWDGAVRASARPPRTRLEHAALTAASAMARSRGDDAAAALLGDVVQQRRTTTLRLVAALDGMPRLPRRRLLRELLTDVGAGACSALERRYLRDVERAHGLPTGTRQRRVVGIDGEVTLRDVEHTAQGVVVELDGRLGHDLGADQWRDLERDLRTAARGEVTLRARWGTVLAPCRLARLVAAVLQARGWRGAPRPCSPGCPVGR